MTMPFGSFLCKVMDSEGLILPARFVLELHITESELAHASGLPGKAVFKPSCLKAQLTQARLREVAEIIDGILPWVGSVRQAFAWYRAQTIPAFGDQTFEDLVKEGRGEAVKSRLGRMAEGGYA